MNQLKGKLKKNIKKGVLTVLATTLGGATLLGNSFSSIEAEASVYTQSAYTQTIPDTVAGSNYAILINQATGEVVAQKNGDAVMYPASMTKVMTILVAAEHVTNLADTVVITQDIIDYCKANDCSTVGFTAGETVTVMDLMWGTILPSGADAAIALGRYVAGSDDAFVAMMNEKAASLGLQNTHFTNCIGLYDANHYTTCNDMAAIMNAATQNQLALTVLATQNYTTTPTAYHPYGVSLTNLFLQRFNSLSTSGVIFAAKTGYISESKYCAVSYYIAESGTPYICVTGMTTSAWNAVYDHQAIYTVYAQ